MSKPPTRAVPEVGGKSPVRMLIVVVLPINKKQLMRRTYTKIEHTSAIGTKQTKALTLRHWQSKILNGNFFTFSTEYIWVSATFEVQGEESLPKTSAIFFTQITNDNRTVYINCTSIDFLPFACHISRFLQLQSRIYQISVKTIVINSSTNCFSCLSDAPLSIKETLIFLI